MAPEERARALEIDARPDTSPAKLALYEMAQRIEAQPGTGSVYLVEYVVNVLHEPKRFADLYAESLPVVALLILPFFTLTLMAFYRRRQLFVLDHLVFIMHVHVFAFVALTVSVVLPGEADPSGAAVAFGGDQDYVLAFGLPNEVLAIVLVIYSFVALKVNYGDGYLMTLVKWPFLVAIYVLVAVVAIVGVAVAIGFLV